MKILSLGLVLSLLVPVSHATLVATDDFSYPDGALSGNSGGSGWASAWAKRGGTNSDAVSGGVASVTGDNSAVFDNQGATYRTMGTSFGVGAELDAWITLDMQRLGGDNSAAFITYGLINGAPPPTGDPSGSYFVGESWTESVWGINATSTAISSANMETLVVHVDYTAGTSELWVNPTLGQDLPGADVTVAATPGTFDTIILRTGGAAAGPHIGAYDNLAIATDAASLGYVIPEPSSLALLGLAGLAFVIHRRRG